VTDYISIKENSQGGFILSKVEGAGNKYHLNSPFGLRFQTTAKLVYIKSWDLGRFDRLGKFGNVEGFGKIFQMTFLEYIKSLFQLTF
jgi:hypothetical protein